MIKLEIEREREKKLEWGGGIRIIYERLDVARNLNMAREETECYGSLYEMLEKVKGYRSS